MNTTRVYYAPGDSTLTTNCAPTFAPYISQPVSDTSVGVTSRTESRVQTTVIRNTIGVTSSTEYRLQTAVIRNTIVGAATVVRCSVYRCIRRWMLLTAPQWTFPVHNMPKGVQECHESQHPHPGDTLSGSCVQIRKLTPNSETSNLSW